MSETPALATQMSSRPIEATALDSCSGSVTSATRPVCSGSESSSTTSAPSALSRATVAGADARGGSGHERAPALES